MMSVRASIKRAACQASSSRSFTSSSSTKQAYERVQRTAPGTVLAGRLGVLGVLAAVGTWSIYNNQVSADASANIAKEQDIAKAHSKRDELIDMKEVSTHSRFDSAWVVVDGDVWDVTEFMMQHPGGSRVILENAGQDVTTLFEAIHPPGTLSKNLAPSQLVGKVDPATLGAASDTARKEKERIQIARDALPPVEKVLGLAEMKRLAETVLSDRAALYYRSGSDNEITLRNNTSDFLTCRFIPRVLVDVGKITAQTQIFGKPSPLPIYISPASNALMGHPEGERNIVRGAAKTGIFQGISAASSLPFEDILDAKDEVEEELGEEMNMGYQIYITQDRSVAQKRIEQARERDVRAFMLTVDSATLGNREENDRLNGLKGDADPGVRMQPADGGDFFHDASITWDDLAWVKSLTKDTPLYLKGVASVEDVQLARDHGLAGVILSNHGGRQLDRSRSGFDSLKALHREKPHLLKELEVYIDGGVTRGAEVCMALCLGAKGVGFGRAFLYAQSAYGEEGVIRTIRILEREINMTLQLVGAKSVADLKPEMLECLRNRWGTP